MLAASISDIAKQIPGKIALFESQAVGRNDTYHGNYPIRKVSVSLLQVLSMGFYKICSYPANGFSNVSNNAADRRSAYVE